MRAAPAVPAVGDEVRMPTSPTSDLAAQSHRVPPAIKSDFQPATVSGTPFTLHIASTEVGARRPEGVGGARRLKSTSSARRPSPAAS